MPAPTANHILNNDKKTSTSDHAPIRRFIKSFTSCTFVLWTRCWIMLQIL